MCRSPGKEHAMGSTWRFGGQEPTGTDLQAEFLDLNLLQMCELASKPPSGAKVARGGCL